MTRLTVLNATLVAKQSAQPQLTDVVGAASLRPFGARFNACDSTITRSPHELPLQIPILCGSIRKAALFLLHLLTSMYGGDMLYLQQPCTTPS
jgi:hypothetical protein